MASENHIVTIRTPDVPLEGSLIVPPKARGLVVFVHGGGSGRTSPRDVYVARELRNHHFGTLLFDLLTRDEAQREMHSDKLRFDVRHLAQRVVGAVDWLAEQDEAEGLPIALYGADMGAAAAIVAAAERPDEVAAVVCRGGRPDLARDALRRDQAPTLLVVGGRDDRILELNRQALDVLPDGQLHVVPGASHLFEEEGTLDRVVTLTLGWLDHHLRQAAPA